jgi:hypothetical protein
MFFHVKKLRRHLEVAPLLLSLLPLHAVPSFLFAQLLSFPQCPRFSALARRVTVRASKSLQRSHRAVSRCSIPPPVRWDAGFLAPHARVARFAR